MSSVAWQAWENSASALDFDIVLVVCVRNNVVLVVFNSVDGPIASANEDHQAATLSGTQAVRLSPC